MNQVNERFLKSFQGGIIGDVYGSVFEFKSKREIPDYKDITEIKMYHTKNVFGHEFGQFTDDTILMLCAMESFLEIGRLDLNDQMRCMGKYIDLGDWTPDGRCFDIGNATNSAYKAWKLGFPCRISDMAGGNGILMKLAPFALYSIYNIENKEEYYTNLTKLTHGKIAVESTIKMGKFLEDLYQDKLTSLVDYGISDSSLDSTGFCNGSWNLALKGYELVENGYLTPEQALMGIIQKGGDTDTNACILGQMLGPRMHTDTYDYKYKDTVNELTRKFCELFE